MNDIGEMTKKIISGYLASESKTEDDKKLQEYLIDGIYREIRQEIVNSEKEKIKKDAENEFESEKQAEKIAKLKNYIVEGILLAFIVGLLVNQVTEVITYLKTQEFLNWSKGVWTFITNLSLAVAIAFIYFTKILNALNDIVKRK